MAQDEGGASQDALAAYAVDLTPRLVTAGLIRSSGVRLK